MFQRSDEDGIQQIAIPLHGSKVKRVYVERSLDLIDELLSIPDSDEDEETEDD